MTAEGSVCGTRPTTSTTTALTGLSKVNAPWTVSLGDTFTGEYEHMCGGTIIGLNAVLTAAHCVTGEDFYVDTFVIVTGVTNLKHTKRGEMFAIDKAIVHPEWQKDSQLHVYFDAALIFTKEQFRYGPDIQPICLPSLGHEELPPSLVGDSVTVVGWGRGDNDEHSGELVQIDVTLRSDHECDTKYNQSTTRRQRLQIKSELPRLLQPSQFCADNNVKYDIGTCNGDSGDPLVSLSLKNLVFRWTWIHKRIQKWGRPLHNLGDSLGKFERSQMWR